MDNSFSGSRYQSQGKDRSPFGRRDQSERESLGREAYVTPQYGRDRNTDEEAEYNRRREEEIKRQIQNRDSEIHNLNRAQQYLQARVDPQYQRSNREPPSYSETRQNIPERDKSPYQLNREGTIVPPAHVKEHIANLQGDNSSLMRRLNLVLQELERVQKERKDLQERLNFVQNEQENLKRMLNGDDKVDKVNKYMQDDLGQERSRNDKIRSKIKEEELYKNELLKDLRQLQHTEEAGIAENQSLNAEIQQKVNHIQDLEKELYYTQEKIRQVNQSIDDMQQQQLLDNAETSHLQRLVESLHQERNDLLQKLDNLTMKYDDCVKEISNDRAEMESHNKRHSKLVTAKIIFQELEKIARNKLKDGFEEFSQYCSFDSKCHQKLECLSKILQSVGEHKLKIGLTIWYQNSLQPIDIKRQSEEISEKIDSDNLKMKMMYAWMQLFNQKQDSYDSKSNAIQVIWQFRKRDSLNEMQRSFTIWKDTLRYQKQKENKFKRLLWKKYFRLLNDAMMNWTTHSSNLDSQVRLNLLSQDFTQKQYLTMLFNNFKYASTVQKSKRINKLLHIWKALKDFIDYRKFLLRSNLTMMRFQKTCNESLLKSCFDAMRIHKEKIKLDKVNYSLNEEELIKIEELTNDIDQRQTEQKFKDKYKAAEYLKHMMSKQLYGVINLWHYQTQQYKEKLRTTVKQKIIKLYYFNLRTTFNKWKGKRDYNKVESFRTDIQGQEAEHQNYSAQILELKNQIQEQSNQRQYQQNRHILKCVQAYEKRMRYLAIGRWRDKVSDINYKEGGAHKIIRRLRLRFLRKAFDLYLNGVKYQKKLEIEENRCYQYNSLRNARLKKRVYASWCAYIQNFKTAKNYWNRIYLRIDLNMKSKALKQWKLKSELKTELILQENQNHVINQIDYLNKGIGDLSQNEEAQRLELKLQRYQMTKQAQRIIGNSFARFFYVSETRGFEKWKEFVKFEKKKERLLKRVIHNWRKQQFYFVKSFLKNWMMQCDIEDKEQQLKKEELRLKDSQFQLQTTSQQLNQNREKLDEELEKVNISQQIYNQRLQKSIQLLINKVDQNDYMSNMRYILQRWRDYVKRQKGFINSIKKVISKSLWKVGYIAISTRSRQVAQESKQERIMRRFFQKMVKRTCANAFSVWRRGLFYDTTQQIEDTSNVGNEFQEEFLKKVKEIKKFNAARSTQIIAKNYLKDLFIGWRNVIQYFKKERISTEILQEEIKNSQLCNSLRKWKSRKDATKLAKLRISRLEQKFIRMRKQLIFNAMVNNYSASKNFLSRMSNLANIHDHQVIKLGFSAIQSFVRAKGFVHGKNKQLGTKGLYDILSNLLLRKQINYFQDLKYRTSIQYKEDSQKMYTVIYFLSNKMRNYFQRWRDVSDLKTTYEELNEEGPVREQYFDQRQELENCKKFLKEEGYSQPQIEEAMIEGSSKNKNLILKALKRIQHYNDDNYAKPLALDRWKQYVHYRKLFRYWLNYSNRRVEYIKSDLAQAFDRWKYYQTTQNQTYMTQPKKELEAKTVKNADKLEKLADAIEDRENAIDHLEKQRDGLVENYIKGQKLALVLCKNNHRLLLFKGFKKWEINYNQESKRQEMDEIVQENVNNISQTKDKLKNLEEDNEALAAENEELRQFSLDGYEIAKSVTQLTKEREQLSVDLADKAKTIKQLLDENESLSQKLKNAQLQAQQLLKTQNKFNPESTGKFR